MFISLGDIVLYRCNNSRSDNRTGPDAMLYLIIDDLYIQGRVSVSNIAKVMMMGPYGHYGQAIKKVYTNSNTVCGE